MKKLLYALLLCFAFFTCSNNDDAFGPEKLIGEWRLIEQYSDPGDGSGGFVLVISSKTIRFMNDGAISSNGDLCSMNTSSDQDITGTYNASENSISPNDCFSSDYILNFEIVGQNLIISYPCIEGCLQKFKKIRFETI